MRALANLFLLPGDYFLRLTHISGEDHRGLVRMLVNTLLWTCIGIVAVVLFL